MPTIHYIFYQCQNPNCGLRFPGPAGSIKDDRCPRCKADLEQIDFVEVNQEADERRGENIIVKIEVLLDNIRSAWNVGSMFRTADGTQIQHVYLCGITPTPVHPTVGRTALGAEKSVPWDYHSNSLELLRTLVLSGYRVWVFEDIPGADNLYEITIDDDPRPILIIVGNEVCGVDPGIIRMADRVISIPMLGRKRSYNVAVAFGIAASYLRYCQTCSQGSTKKFPNT